MRKLSRRDFLKSATAGMAGVAAMGLMGSVSAAEDEATVYPGFLGPEDFTCSPVELTPITAWDEENSFDIVVVGAGTSGLPAVMTALEEGCSVCCLQKEANAVAQGASSSGFDLAHCNEMGILRFIQQYREECSYRVDLRLVDFYVRHSGETILAMRQWAKNAGNAPYIITSSYSDLDEGGYITKVMNRFGPKPANNGTLMIAMAEHAKSLGAEFYYNTPGVQLIMDDGVVTGIFGKTEDGKYIRFNANKAVILATGDYQNNPGLVGKFSPDLSRFEKKQFNKTGDGILMAMAIGGYMTPVGHSHQVHDVDSCPALLGDAYVLAVNENGERFMNEEIPGDFRNQTLRLLKREQAGKFCLVMDDNFPDALAAMGIRGVTKEAMRCHIPGEAEKMPNEITDYVSMGIYPGLVDTHCCDTLEELAAALGVPADNLLATVERYNELAQAGADLDFGVKAEYLFPIETPPFWGVKKHYRVSALGGGVSVDGNYQCVDTEDESIPGLYAVGFGAGAICGDVDWNKNVTGMSCASCMTSGRYATLHAIYGKLEAPNPYTMDRLDEDLRTDSGVVDPAAAQLTEQINMQ